MDRHLIRVLIYRYRAPEEKKMAKVAKLGVTVLILPVLIVRFLG